MISFLLCNTCARVYMCCSTCEHMCMCVHTRVPTPRSSIPPGLGMTYRAGAGSVFTQEQNAGDVKIDTTEFETLPHPRDRERKRKGEGGTRQACHRRGGGWRRPLRGTREERKGAKPRLGQRTARRWGGDRPVRRPPPRQRTLTRATLRPAAHAPGWREFKSRGKPSRVGKCGGNIGGALLPPAWPRVRAGKMPTLSAQK